MPLRIISVPAIVVNDQRNFILPPLRGELSNSRRKIQTQREDAHRASSPFWRQLFPILFRG
jgi:hypothetical protein